MLLLEQVRGLHVGLLFSVYDRRDSVQVGEILSVGDTIGVGQLVNWTITRHSECRPMSLCIYACN